MAGYLSAALLTLMPVAPQQAAAAEPAFDVPVARAWFTRHLAEGDLTIFDAPAFGRGPGKGIDLVADLALNFALDDPYGSASGHFSLRLGVTELLSGLLGRIRVTQGGLSLRFGDLGGGLAGAFGGGLAVGMVFADPPGDDPLTALTHGLRYPVALTGTAVPVSPPCRKTP